MALNAAWAASLEPVREAQSAFEEARQMMANGQFDRAEILLERVLMLMPEHAEARVEFALLMARRGQVEAARALLESLIDDPATGPAHRARLRALVRALESSAALPAAPTPPAGNGLLAQRERPGARKPPGPSSTSSTPSSLAIGAEADASASGRKNGERAQTAPDAALWRAEAGYLASSNPLARTQITELTLTPSYGPVTLPLAARPAAGGIAALSIGRTAALSGWDVSVQYLHSPRAGEEASGGRFSAWGLVPLPSQLNAWRALAAGQALQWSLQVQQGFDGQIRKLASLAHVGPVHRTAWGAYAETPTADRGHLVRHEHRLSLPGPLDAVLSVERSQSQTNDAGHWRLGVVSEVALPANLRLWAQMTLQEDTRPYSVLLENNAVRRLATLQLSLERSWRVTEGSAVVLRGFAARRQSNLDLFDFRDGGVQVAVVRLWK